MSKKPTVEEPLVYDIPVLFQVRAWDQDRAANFLRDVLWYNEIIQGTDGTETADEREIQSWHMPNHKEVDGSDDPVRVVVIPLVSPLRATP